MIQFNDYCPFGMSMAPRSGMAANEGYRYGFNGMEGGQELKGSGNSYDFGARMHDPRIGRFMSIDPRFKDFPYMSPYVFAANNPIRFIDENEEGPGDGRKRQFVTAIELETSKGIQTVYLRKTYYENATPSMVRNWTVDQITDSGWELSNEAQFNRFRRWDEKSKEEQENAPSNEFYAKNTYGADTPRRQNYIPHNMSGDGRFDPVTSTGNLNIVAEGKGMITYGYYDSEGKQVLLGQFEVDGTLDITMQYDVSKGDGGMYVVFNAEAPNTVGVSTYTPEKKVRKEWITCICMGKTK